MIALLIWFVSSHWQEFSRITEVGYAGIFYVIVLFLVSRICVVLPLIAITKHLGTKLKYFEAMQIDMATSFLNYIISKAGLLIRGVYLKKNYSFSYSSYSSLLIAMSLLQLFACGCLGLFFSAFLLKTDFGSISIIFVFFFLICLLCIAGAFVPYIFSGMLRNKDGWLAKNMFRVLSACEELRAAKSLISIIILWALLGSLVIGLRLYVCYRLLGYEVSWLAVLVMAMAAISARTVSIVPGGLGIREFVVGIVGVGLGNMFEVGVVAATLDRIGVLIAIGSLGSVSFFKLYRKAIKEE